MVKKINHTELKKLVTASYKIRIPLMIYGGIGIGKSEVIKGVSEEIAKERKKEFVDWNNIGSKEKRDLVGNTKGKFVFYDIRATQIEPSDLRGLPSFNNKKRDYVDWKPNLIFSLLSEKDSDGIIFFDEVNNAVPMVMASLYQIFLDKAIGEVSLSKDIGIIGAGNRVGTDKANVFDIPAPLKDRMSEVELLVPDIEAWTNWGLEDDKIGGRIISFLNWKPSWLYDVDSKSADKSTTPRGWKRCSDLIKGIADTDEVELLCSSAVGEGVATEFMAFLKLQRKVSAEDLLKNPKKVREIKELDLKYSLLSSISEYYRKHQNKQVLARVFGVCRELDSCDSVEFSVLLLRMCNSIDEKFFRAEIYNIKEAKDILKSYAKFVIE